MVAGARDVAVAGPGALYGPGTLRWQGQGRGLGRNGALLDRRTRGRNIIRDAHRAFGHTKCVHEGLEEFLALSIVFVCWMAVCMMICQ